MGQVGKVNRSIAAFCNLGAQVSNIILDKLFSLIVLIPVLYASRDDSYVTRFASFASVLHFIDSNYENEERWRKEDPVEKVGTRHRV